MRPVRFVAVAEDGQSLILADEAGRMLSLPLEEAVLAAVRREHGSQSSLSVEVQASLSPRDIQARIRSGDSAEDVARAANVPIDRVLRYAGPVLAERAAVAIQARRTRLRTAEDGSSLAKVIDAKLRTHGVDADAVTWDAFRQGDGTWRVTATWPSGRSTAHAVWDLDRPRQVVTPVDDIAHYLSTDRASPVLAHEVFGGAVAPDKHGPASPEVPGVDQAKRHGALPSSTSAPPSTEAGPDAAPAAGQHEHLTRPRIPTRTSHPSRSPRPAAAALGTGPARRGDDADTKELPAIPSLTALRTRRGEPAAVKNQPQQEVNASRRELPSWDDVLFGRKR